MPKPFQTFSRMALLLLWLAGGSPLAAQTDGEIAVSSDVNPSTIRMGATARYTIDIVQTNSGNFGLNASPNGSVPEVPGLNITYLGQSSSTRTSYSNITGTTRAVTLTLNYQVRPQSPGTYEIPAFRILFEGREYQVPAATLRVRDAEATTPDGDTPPLMELGMLLPEEKVFVGQALKANLQLFVLDRIPNIRTDYPVKIGDAWAQGAMADNQTRSRASYRGYEYDVYSRPLLLTPLKAGVQELLYEMTVQALLPTSGSIFDDKNATAPNSPFNDPFFQQFNFRVNPQMQYQNRTVETELLKIEVHPLPEENQPVAFSGAIGDFTLKAFPGSNSVKAGDPITLRLQIAGQGNFDRILPPVLELGDQWRTYDPETSFRQGDILGFSGVKHFDYTLIPLDPDLTHIPEISIAYFDPRTEEYEVLTTGQIPLTVEENPNLDLNQIPQVAAESRADDLPALFALQTEPGRWVAFSAPLLKSTTFLALQGVPLLALATLVIVRRRRLKLQQDLEKKRLRELDKRLLALQAHVGQAVQQRDTAAAITGMLQGYRLVLSKPFGPKAEAATREDIEALLADLDLPDNLRQAIESSFHQGEAIAYAGAHALKQDLPDLRRHWEQTLKQLQSTLK